MSSSRYEVTGNTDIGLPTARPMVFAGMVGREMARTFAPANGAVGKINATIKENIGYYLTGAQDENRHIRWDQLIQEPIGARLLATAGPGAVGPGDIELLDPGEWTIDTAVRFDGTAYTGNNLVEVVVTVRDSTGTILRQQSSVASPGTAKQTVTVHLADALITEAQLPATVDVWFTTGRWRSIRGGAGFTVISVKKTERYATATEFMQDGGEAPQEGA
ncbi:MAG: hypothetical protein LKG15_07875 [Corynebacterium provencense]|jgi:hypothetical protein|uniref:hypothetical protein n=1 Tax=Corynebacterium provencense TaxID=1737425 RepID=UPI002989DC9C|nr:hypothetical protein [Corynebacterium provencense]